eukprot:gene27109-biopygen17662
MSRGDRNRTGIEAADPSF